MARTLPGSPARQLAPIAVTLLILGAVLPPALATPNRNAHLASLPSKELIAFLGGDYPGSVFGRDRIYVVRADETHLRSLMERDANILSLAVSPDGSTIAFDQGSGEFPPRHLYVIGTDGTGKRRITGGDGWDVVPSWSPDGSRIAAGCSAAHAPASQSTAARSGRPTGPGSRSGSCGTTTGTHRGAGTGSAS